MTHTYGLGQTPKKPRQRDKRAPKPMTKVCAWCGDEFETADARQCYCTTETSIIDGGVPSCAEMAKDERRETGRRR